MQGLLVALGYTVNLRKTNAELVELLKPLLLAYRQQQKSAEADELTDAAAVAASVSSNMARGPRSLSLWPIPGSLSL